jgi:mRNA-degrading endonuclease toxin of MazEF toxin-antitoxin module
MSRSASGLRLDSAIRCDRLFTVDHKNIHRTIGRVSPATLHEVDQLLKLALAIQ